MPATRVEHNRKEMVELIAYCVYATLPPRGPQVANAKRFCYSVCQLFGTSLWIHFLFVYLLVPVLCAFGWSCFAILCVLMGKVFWFLAGKVPSLPWHIGIFVCSSRAVDSMKSVRPQWPQLSPSNLDLMWLHYARALQCSATQSTFITHTRRGTKPSCGAALSQGLRSFCSSRRAVVHFQFV